MSAKSVVYAKLIIKAPLGDGIGQRFAIVRYNKRSVRLPCEFPNVGLRQKLRAAHCEFLRLFVGHGGQQVYRRLPHPFARSLGEGWERFDKCVF